VASFYQVNLTLRLIGRIVDPESLYAALATAQQGSHHALIHTPAHTVVSASPELFFERTGDRIVTRPMKGTAPRNPSPELDTVTAHELSRSEKDCAENIMIVDLLRNDLGRIARPGSVRVPALLEVEGYPTVWQLTSTIEACLPDNVSLAEVMRALFPCGSVTGAPKQRSMHAIAALEGRPRGVYCGTIGYLEPDRCRPPTRFAVAIRTAVVTTAGYAEYGSGGAITYSSHSDTEWQELVAKSAILRA
jgi:para-aminobenzoate synthetase/4-amino-4-deoxychorismate lyase